jgi:NADPH:quinone reductase-like Zn-dependent oxidoreductase
MKAVVYHTYGPPDVLHCEDVDKPSPTNDEILIKVRAASVNPMDCHFMSGVLVMRPMTGLFKPKMTRPGVDLAGEVEAVGTNVTRFRVGDPVFGVARGAFAEYVCASENRLAMKPANLTFEQAAAIPVAASTALQGLRDRARIQPGQKVLINGAAGGVGTFAVQIARSFGAEVTGVCSAKSVDLVRSIGADHVVDYTRDDVTRSTERYDVILDTAGSHPLSAWRRVMTSKATFLPIGARPGGRWIGLLPHLLKLFISSRLVSQNVVFFVATVVTDDLNVLKNLVEANKVTPIVDTCYTLGEAAAAVRHLKEGHPRGKVVLTVSCVRDI